MIKLTREMLKSRAWVALSLACAVYALYEAATEMIAGHGLEGLADILLTVVFLINFINRFKSISGYVRRLRQRG